MYFFITVIGDNNKMITVFLILVTIFDDSKQNIGKLFKIAYCSHTLFSLLGQNLQKCIFRK